MVMKTDNNKMMMKSTTSSSSHSFFASASRKSKLIQIGGHNIIIKNQTVTEIKSIKQELPLISITTPLLISPATACVWASVGLGVKKGMKTII